jgi:hypothetical protein
MNRFGLSYLPDEHICIDYELDDPIHKKMDESHLIGTEEDDNDDFEFV